MPAHRNGRVHGHVYLRSGKRGDSWYARIFTPDLPNGRRVRLGAAWNEDGERQPHGSLTHDQAQDALDERLVELRRNVAPATLAGVTMRHAIAEWLRWCDEEHPSGLKPKTLKDYRSTATVWDAYFGDTPLTAVDEDALDEYMVWLRNDRGSSTRTRIKHLTMIRQVFKRAQRKWGLQVNPALLVTRPRAHDEDYFNVLSEWSDVATLAAQGTTLQDRVMILTAAGTGMRMGELRALRWIHLHLDRPVGGNFLACVHESYVDGVLGTPKSHARRDIPLTPPVRDGLLELRRSQQLDGRWTREGNVFLDADGAEYIDDDKLRRRYKKMVEAAGLPHLRFHDLRHTFGTLAVRGGLATEIIQKYMGHHSIVVTQRYVHFVMPGDAGSTLGNALMGSSEAPARHLRAV